MNCKKCGLPLSEDDLFCGNCGQKVELSQAKEEPKEQEKAAPNEQATYQEPESTDYVFNPYEVQQQNDIHEVPEETEQIDAEADQDVAHDVVEDISAGEETAGKGKISFRIDKKKAIIAAIIIAAVVVLIIVAVVIVKVIEDRKLKAPVVIDLEKYVVSECIVFDESGSQYGTDDVYYEEEQYNAMPTNLESGKGLVVNGFSKYASIYQEQLYNVVDWDSLKQDATQQLIEKKGHENDMVENYLSADTFAYGADQYNDIGNGDEITISIGAQEGAALSFDEISFSIIATTQKYKVDNLKEVNAFDPFDYVQLISTGPNGYASLSVGIDEDLDEDIPGADGFSVEYYGSETIAVVENGYVIATIQFSLEDSAGGSEHKNGEIITMYCTCDEASDLISKNNLYIAKYKREYELTKLGNYISKKFNVSDAELNMFRDHVKTIIKEEYGDNDSYHNFQYKTAYIVELKDKTKSSYNFHNEFCMIYSYTYTGWNDEDTTEYMCVRYRDLVEYDNEIVFEPESYYYSKSTGFEDAGEALENYSDDYFVTEI